MPTAFFFCQPTVVPRGLPAAVGSGSVVAAGLVVVVAEFGPEELHYSGSPSQSCYEPLTSLESEDWSQMP